MCKYMNDCIHLEACRRIQKIGKKLNLTIPRYCDEKCTAYKSGEKIIYIDEVEIVDGAITLSELIKWT